MGHHGLFADTSGHDNTALGHGALNSNTGGDQNIAIGSGAGADLTSGDDNVDIANDGQAGESGTIRIGTQGQQTRGFAAGEGGRLRSARRAGAPAGVFGKPADEFDGLYDA